MEWIENIIQWGEVNPLLCWLAIYLMILFVMTVLGWVIGSYKIGFIWGLTVVNATSLVWATWVTGSQPWWMTMCIFLFSVIIAFVLLCRGSQSDKKEGELVGSRR